MKFCTVIALVASTYAEEADIPAEARGLGHRRHHQYAPLPVVYSQPLVAKAPVLPVLSKGVPLTPSKTVYPPTPLLKKETIVPRIAIEKTPIVVPTKKGPIAPLTSKHTPIVSIPTKKTTPIVAKPSKFIPTAPLTKKAPLPILTKKAPLPVLTKNVAPVISKETIVTPTFVKKGGLRHLGGHHNKYYPVGYANGVPHHHHNKGFVPVVAAPQVVPVIAAQPVVQVAQPIISKESKKAYVY